MTDVTAAPPVEPFESASELRAANARLLDLYDRALEKDASADGDIAALRAIEAEARDFLQRGAATGAYIEETKERTGCQVLLDYWLSSLARAGVPLSSVRLARFDGEQLPDLKDKPCPYVGLEAFRDNKFFFGRDGDTQALVAQVRGAPLVIVFGPSGSGKSSLVMGGAVPALAASDNSPSLRIVPAFVPGNAVLANLAEAVAQVCPGIGVDDGVARLRADGGALESMLGGAGAPATLLVIDQFEELFTLSESADRDALVANLAALLGGTQGHRVILTMREEFRSRIVELEGFKKFTDRAWYPMRPMGYEELKAAVERPAALVNLQFQSGIVDDLVKRVLGQPAALPLLQFTLRALWDQRDRNRITWEVYQKVGDPLSALKSSADRFYHGLAPQTQDEVRRILLELVRVDDLLEAYRQPVPKSRLLQAGKANTEAVLELLSANDYVRIAAGKGGADAIVEVKHESLVRNWPRLVGWIDDKRIARRRRLALSEAARRWEKTGKPTEGLLTGWQLEEAKHLADLSALENEFISASSAAVENALREEKQAMQRKFEQELELARALVSRKRMIGGLVGVAIFGMILGVTAYYFRNEYEGLSRQKKQLDGYAAELESKRAKLERERDQLEKFLETQKRRSVDRANPVRPQSRATIFLHILRDDQRPLANKLAQRLQANKFIVPGVERVKVDLRKSDVRYFRENDVKGAVEIVKYLKEFVGSELDIVTTLIQGYQQKVPDNYYEVWLTPEAFGRSR